MRLQGVFVDGPEGRASPLWHVRSETHDWFAWPAGGCRRALGRPPSEDSIRTGRASGQAGVACAPCSGRLVRVLVAPGDVLAPGATVAIIEAMKLEFAVAAAAGGRVTEVLASEGSVLEQGAAVVRICAA